MQFITSTTMHQQMQYAENRGTHGTVDMIVITVHARDKALQDLDEIQNQYACLQHACGWSEHTAKWHPHMHKRKMYKGIAEEQNEKMRRLQDKWVSTNAWMEHCDQLLNVWDMELSEIDSCIANLAAHEISMEDVEECAHSFYEDAYHASEFDGRDVTVNPEQFTMVLADPCEEVMCMTIGHKGENFSKITALSNVVIIWHERSCGIIFIRSHEKEARAHATWLIRDAMKKNRSIVEARFMSN